jgi:predicted lipoprotein with Yx(FWY)xxD motif
MVSGVAVRFMGVRRTLRWMGAVVALAAAACGNDTGASGGNNGGGANPPPGGQPAPGGTPSIGLGSSPTLGNYLVSAADGRTLYYFGLDVPAGGGQGPTSNCTGSCLAVWPVFHAPAGGGNSPPAGQPDGGSPPPPPPPSVPPYLVQGSSPALTVATGLNASDFGEFTRADGTTQTTFQGWPLYEFSGDSKAGDTNGDDFVGSGAPWYVIKNPFYSALAMTKTGGPAIYLADPAGRTLYVFAQDTVGTASTPPVSNCTGACLAAWPAFLAGGDVVPTGIDPAKLTTFTRADGTQQSAFDGHPLYYFQNDTQPGQINGQGVNSFSTVDPTSL